MHNGPTLCTKMKDEARKLPLSLVDLLLDAVLLVDTAGRVVYVNAACERIFGYSPDEIIGRSMIDFVAPEDRDRTLEEARIVMTGQPRIGFENRYVRKDGSLVPIMWSARWSEADQLRIGVARDITERKRAEELQAATYAVSEAAHDAVDLTSLFREIDQIIAKLVPLAGLAVATCTPGTSELTLSYERNLPELPSDMQTTFLKRYCSEAVLNGRPRTLSDDELLATRPGKAATDADQPYLVMPLIDQKEAVGALILKSRDGAGYSDKDRELLHFVSAQIATAIKRRQLTEELMQSARYDDLTGLPNRRLLHDRIRSALARSRGRGTRMAVLFIDIDGFKQVNDSLGHATGDRLLKKVAQRLKECLREEDTVARLGGDEFVVLVEDLGTPQDAVAIAEKVRSAIGEPVNVDKIALKAAASIGTAVYPEHGVEPEQLLRHADAAMYLDKKAKTGETSWDR